jgi:DNA-binding response OmpR family regulator
MDPSTRNTNELDRRVLLVEDDPDTLGLMRRLLAHLSLAAVPTSTCADAWRAAESLGGLDLVITDEVLPDGRGAQLASGLARRYGCGAIVVSGSPPEASLPAGVGVWLTKPIDFTRFREAVLALVA